MKSNQIFNDVTILIVTHNAENVLTNFLESLNPKFKLVIVDNASSDNTREIIKQYKTEKYRVILNKFGVGFGRGSNLGIKSINTKFTLLINPDTTINLEAIKKLYESAKLYENASILSPLHRNSNNEIHIPSRPFFYNNNKDRLTIKNFKGDCSVEHLSGAVMLLNNEKINKIGLFDENFFLYFEDDDLCIKSKKAGFENILVFDAVIDHIAGGSIGPPNIHNQWEKFSNMSFSRCYIEKKYFGKLRALKISTLIIFRSILKFIGHILILKFKKLLRDLAHLYGALFYLIGNK